MEINPSKFFQNILNSKNLIFYFIL